MAASDLDIVFEPLYEDVDPPERATLDAAGYDAKAYLKGREITVFDSWNTECIRQGPILTLWPRWRAKIPLGFRAQLPVGKEMQVRPRSGHVWRKGLVVANTPGTIDADYPDEWMVLLWNISDVCVEVLHGERIAQLVPAEVLPMTWQRGTVRQTTERVGGFGSTGTR